MCVAALVESRALPHWCDGLQCRVGPFDVNPPPTRPPALDRLVESPPLRALIRTHGRPLVLARCRDLLDGWRALTPRPAFDPAAFEAHVASALAAQATPALRPVFNLTGTVLHTNLGRAVLAPQAMQAVQDVMGRASTLEYDVQRGTRGERDEAVAQLLCELTGAQAATVVNNNAAAVLLVLAALAPRREVLVSRGELVEIGGAFRIPDVMRQAGAKLVEVGTTNRTHLHDFGTAIGPRSAVLMKVHASNYAIQGFTASVPMAELAALAHQHGLPCVEDLGSGSLVDLARWGLPAEPTPQMSLAAGVDLVTFSGDKLLGGPQAGLIVGRKALVDKIRRHPLKRALRLDKMTLAALEATLKLYRDPDRLAQRLPTLRLLTRPLADIRATAEQVAPVLARALGASATVQVQACMSQIGSGSLPVDTLPSACVAIGLAAGQPASARPGRWLQALADALRALPTPVIGRIEADRLLLDMRTLETADDQVCLCTQLVSHLSPPRTAPAAL